MEVRHGGATAVRVIKIPLENIELMFFKADALRFLRVCVHVDVDTYRVVFGGVAK